MGEKEVTGSRIVFRHREVDWWMRGLDFSPAVSASKRFQSNRQEHNRGQQGQDACDVGASSVPSFDQRLADKSCDGRKAAGQVREQCEPSELDRATNAGNKRSDATNVSVNYSDNFARRIKQRDECRESWPESEDR